MNAEEFILIPKSQYLQSRPVQEQVLYAPNLSSKSQYLSVLKRYDPDEKRESMRGGDQETAPDIKSKILSELTSLTASQQAKSRLIIDQIGKSKRIGIDQDLIITVDGERHGMNAGTFLYNLQQSKARIDEEIYKIILNELNLAEHLVANSKAKEIIRSSWYAFKK